MQLNCKVSVLELRKVQEEKCILSPDFNILMLTFQISSIKY